MLRWHERYRHSLEVSFRLSLSRGLYKNAMIKFTPKQACMGYVSLQHLHAYLISMPVFDDSDYKRYSAHVSWA